MAGRVERKPKIERDRRSGPLSEARSPTQAPSEPGDVPAGDPRTNPDMSAICIALVLSQPHLYYLGQVASVLHVVMGSQNRIKYYRARVPATEFISVIHAQC